MSLQKLLVKDVNSIVLSLKFKKGKGSERGESPETLHCKKQMFFDYVNLSCHFLSVFGSSGRRTILDQEKVKHFSIQASLQIVSFLLNLIEK